MMTRCVLWLCLLSTLWAMEQMNDIDAVVHVINNTQRYSRAMHPDMSRNRFACFWIDRLVSSLRDLINEFQIDTRSAHRDYWTQTLVAQKIREALVVVDAYRQSNHAPPPWECPGDEQRLLDKIFRIQAQRLPERYLEMSPQERDALIRTRQQDYHGWTVALENLVSELKWFFEDKRQYIRCDQSDALRPAPEPTPDQCAESGLGTVTETCISECSVCLSNPATHIAYPCGHRCACQKCSVGLDFYGQDCPGCREGYHAGMYMELTDALRQQMQREGRQIYDM